MQLTRLGVLYPPYSHYLMAVLLVGTPGFQTVERNFSKQTTTTKVFYSLGHEHCVKVFAPADF